MYPLEFKTKLFSIKSRIILKLPSDVSKKLPSRGTVMVKGTLNKVDFKALLEPDGVYMQNKETSHWFSPSNKLLKLAEATAGDIVDVSIEPTDEWIEPEVPEDFKNALNKSKKAEELWKDITPMARWDWIRWIRAVKTMETRKKHIDVAISKLNNGLRRPCCFNRSMCSDPEVSHNWVLLSGDEEN